MNRALITSIWLSLLLASRPAWGQETPSNLPRYELDLHVDPAQRLVLGKMLVTWTNTTTRPTSEIVFNVHARYSVPDKDIGLLAKTLEVLRIAPSEAISFDGPALEMQKILYHPKADAAQVIRNTGRPGAAADRKLFSLNISQDSSTDLKASLPEEVAPGETVQMELQFTIRLPAKKGRWGQWGDITTLAQGLPTLAVYDEAGWHPTPFIPWHQPFHNEAGHYSGSITLPADQKLACSAGVQETVNLGKGWVRHELAPVCVRDFSFMCSSRYQEHLGKADGVVIRVLALPEHEHYAKKIVQTIEEALPVYNRWFGRYPYPQFTVAESHFGWNGNECGGLVMIDSRVFGLPHLASAWVDYLVTHELCHQWWYNVVGTHGYAETWMDEGLATYFSHRLIDQKIGPNNELLAMPAALAWLPNIRREDYRLTGYLSAVKRGDGMPTVQEMPKYRHLMNLTAMTYDRGGKVVGMIEQRLGPDNMLDFMRLVYRKYQFRILRVADFQKELEEYTRQSWDEFFQHWVYGKDQCDWRVERVVVSAEGRPTRQLAERKRRGQEPVRVVVEITQRGPINEPTVLGIRMPGDKEYSYRIPIVPSGETLKLDELAATVNCVMPPELGRGASVGGVPGEAGALGRCLVRVEMTLPCAPEQISVDPDHVLLDSQPANNHWQPETRVRLTPLYTFLEETDVTNPSDRWNIIAGPWLHTAIYSDPWYVRSPIAGFRVGAFRTQEFSGGAFVGYRTNDRNLIAGLDATWMHVLPQLHVGLNIEKSLATLADERIECSRGVLFARKVIMSGSSFYLPPFEYVEVFAAYQNRCLPDPRVSPPGADPFNDRTSLGIHYHKNFLTPYWDAEGGIAIDVTYQAGLPIFGTPEAFHQLYGQVSLVKSMPKMDWLGEGPLLDWLRQTRFAVRLAAAGALPDKGQFFALGGGDGFRGYDLSERQGSVTWVGSVEWRIPLAKDVCWDVCDHVAGVRNVYLAPFYDVGDALVNGRSLGPVAHAFGVGVRVDIAWLGLIERTTLRADVARAVSVDSPWQFWFGLQHPF